MAESSAVTVNWNAVPAMPVTGAETAKCATPVFAAAKTALEVFPVPPFADVTCTLAVKLPAVTAVTLTATVHDPAGDTAPPLNPMVALPAAAVTTPPHEFDTLGVAVTVTPAGRVATNATPEMLPGLTAGFVIANVKVDAPLTAILCGLKLKPIAGGAITLRTAEAVFPVPP